MQADDAAGRVISVGLFIKMTPIQDVPLGRTDMAIAIGRGLIEEVTRMVQSAGEQEGFRVEITTTNVVY